MQLYFRINKESQVQLVSIQLKLVLRLFSFLAYVLLIFLEINTIVFSFSFLFCIFTKVKISLNTKMNSVGAIQIIIPKNHKFELQLENLKQIFESANIKDRNVVILSIAGPYRKGKSFILNFFLRYLYAQVIEIKPWPWWYT